MPFEEGNKGRPKGVKNRKTQAWDELGDFITKEGAKSAMRIINHYGEMVQKEDGTEEIRNPDKFLLHYSNLLEYFKPKQARVENVQDGETVVRVIHD